MKYLVLLSFMYMYNVTLWNLSETRRRYACACACVCVVCLWGCTPLTGFVVGDKVPVSPPVTLNCVSVPRCNWGLSDTSPRVGISIFPGRSVAMSLKSPR